MNIFRRLFKPKSANDFVKLFIKESINRHVRMEVYYKNAVLMNVDRINYLPGLISLISEDEKLLFNNGYVVHFTMEESNIPDSRLYKNFLKNKNQLKMIKHINKKRKIVSFYHFIENKTSFLEIAKYMRLLIDSIYEFPDNNPQLVFNLRYVN